MESRELRNWAIFQAAITSVLILGSWILVAGSFVIFGQFSDRLEFPEILDPLLGILGVGLMFFIPFFWSYRLVRKTVRHLSQDRDSECGVTNRAE